LKGDVMQGIIILILTVLLFSGLYYVSEKAVNVISKSNERRK